MICSICHNQLDPDVEYHECQMHKEYTFIAGNFLTTLVMCSQECVKIHNKEYHQAIDIS